MVSRCGLNLLTAADRQRRPIGPTMFPRQPCSLLMLQAATEFIMIVYHIKTQQKRVRRFLLITAVYFTEQI